MNAFLKKSLVVALGVSSILMADISAAKNLCSNIFRDRSTYIPVEAVAFSQSRDLGLQLSPAQAKAIDAAIETQLGEKLLPKRKPNEPVNIPDLVVMLANKAISLGGERSQQSDRIANISRAFDKVTAKLPLETRKLVNFTFAKAILDIEAFKEHEYVQGQSIAMVDKQMKYVHAKDFLKMTKSYIDKTEEYESVPAYGQGILTFKDIRDIEVYNLFPVELKGHDIRHVHFGSGHPLAVGVMWSSARSSVPERWLLMGALFEGVDTIQYGFETSLARLMHKKGFDQETAMIEMSRYTNAELKALISEIGMGGYVPQFTDYKPSKVGIYGPEGITGKGLEVELMKAVEYLYDQQKSKNSKYTNYDRNPPTGGSKKADNAIHF